jgi:hypothetical protein
MCRTSAAKLRDQRTVSGEKSMKRVLIAALLAGQLTAAAQPAFAAGLAEPSRSEMGAFAGLRVRMPLDGNAGQRQLRAGLTVAPAMHSRTANGESRLRIGKGLELGLAGDQPLRLSLGGSPVAQLAQGPMGPDGRRMGVSTVGWIAIGVGAAALVTFGLGYVVYRNSDDRRPGVG